MILFLAFILNSLEAVLEAIFNYKDNKLHRVIEKFHILVVLMFFALWVLTVFWQPYDLGYIRLFLGFWFVRFLVYDFAWNLTTKILGIKIPLFYNGDGEDNKWYEDIMIKLGGFGWFLKIFVFGPIGICFLMGWDGNHIKEFVKSIL
jgi:hypothetical protein